MKKMTLLVLAAGMGSRYGGLKQMDGVGPNEESIIDYSVFDAIAAGFNKVVFVIREEFAEDFTRKVSDKYRDAIEVVHVYQSLDTGFEQLPCPEERIKPWGTSHAVLVARDVIDEPFAVINADDYYGKDAFVQSANFLKGLESSDLAAIIGYQLSNTLSDHGHVNRGVCSVDENFFLKDVVECEKIFRRNGQIIFGTEEKGFKELAEDTVVSMNYWLFHHEIFDELEARFEEFLEENRFVPKSEFYIPTFIDKLIKENLIQVLVLESEDSWYGVTYREDKEAVQQSMKHLHEVGEYPNPLEY